MTGGPNGSATGKHIAEADKFWDISSLVPERARTAPRDRKTDTTTAKIDLDGAPEKAGEPIPEKKPEKNSAAPRREIEYEGSGPVSRVRVTPWPTGYTFYSRFAAQAAALWRKKCAKCDPVNFFSYMPQYDQMTTAQLKYYLYWRDLVRHGEYPHVECSYVLLYLYEIINLPKLIPVHVGATLIALVWAAYRDAYPYLDKYAGEWLCDYCMIYDTPVPTELPRLSQMTEEELTETLVNLGVEIPEDTTWDLRSLTALFEEDIDAPYPSDVYFDSDHMLFESVRAAVKEYYGIV